VAAYEPGRAAHAYGAQADPSWTNLPEAGNFWPFPGLTATYTPPDRSPMSIRLLLPAAAVSAALVAPAAASATAIAPDSVVVRYDHSATHSQRIAALDATGTSTAAVLPGENRALAIDDGESVGATLEELRAQPAVKYAHPNYKLSASAAPEPFYPNDPGRGGSGDWRELQWNFDGPFGIRAPQAWAYARAAGHGGGRGATVAVIDSGVAYVKHGKFRRAPDLYPRRFVRPYDYIQHDRYPLDEDGHGTHVTGTIAQRTNNKLGVTGVAYGVNIMPLRVLDDRGDGDGATFARSIKYAAKHGADVINMSVEFDTQLRAADIPEVIAAIKYAHKRGAVMVGASGNDTEGRVAYPARSSYVIAVGATTAGGCQAEYSNYGSGLDVVAPGGGTDAPLSDNDWDATHCDSGRRSREIYQQTFLRKPTDFHLVGFEGTSEAAPHVSAIAALLIGTGRLGDRPSPEAVQKRIEDTARDLGPSGYDKRYGYGLVNAAAALAP
jgi:serine protease